MGCIPSPARPGYRPWWAARNGRVVGLLVLVILLVGTGGVSGAMPADTVSAGTTIPAPFTRITEYPTVPPPPPPPPAGPPVLSLDPPQVSGKTVTISGSVRPGGPEAVIDLVIWDWGDGDRETQNTLPVTHTYTAGGMYTIWVKAIQSEIGAPEKRLTSTNSLPVSIPTPAPTHVPTRLGAVVAYSADAHDGTAVVTFDGASDEYGCYTVYRYPGGRGWYRHQSQSSLHQEPWSQIEDPSMPIVGTVDVAASLPVEARHVYAPFRYAIGDIVGETATGPYRVVTWVEEGDPSYYSPGRYVHKLVWKDDQGRWRTYDEGSGETYDNQADFEARYPAKQAHVELGTVIGGGPTTHPSVSTPTTATTTRTTTTTTMPTPFPVSSPMAAQPTPIVIVVRETADIDPGMTPYSGLTAPPTTPVPPAAAPASRPSSASAITGSAMTVPAAPTTVAAQQTTFASAVATTSAPADGGFPVLLAMGALLAVFVLVVGGIAYRSYLSREDDPVEIMSRPGSAKPGPSGAAPTPAGDVTAQAPWDGYSPLASDSYDLLARLRRYEDAVGLAGSGRSVSLADRLDLTLVPTLPIPATVRELGPGVGCRVISVDHLGSAVCLRDQGTTAERLDVVKVEEILGLIEERYEQRWVPKERDAD